MAAEIGHPLLDPDLDRLQAFCDWLRSEAIPAGALGAAETDRLHDRHIADSLLFANLLEGSDRVIDLGSGAGLPGIPLAVMLPETHFVLLDRSGKRVDLMRRAKRILELQNVEVIQGEIESLGQPVPALVSRATLPPDRARPLLWSLLEPGGRAVLGGSWVVAPTHEGFETVEVESKILDRTIWLLIMRRT